MAIEQPVSYWYDATIEVRIYLHASPATDDEETRERIEDEVTGLLDTSTRTALLSYQDIDLGDLRDDSALHRPG